jgi:LysM repeat protein
VAVDAVAGSRRTTYHRRGMSAFPQIPLRMLAPVSLGLFAVVFLIVVVSSLNGGSGSVGSKSPAPATRSSSRSASGSTSSTPARRGLDSREYVIKPGDTLSKIASATGVPVEQLQALNPLIDPKGLVTGQRIKLRE